MFQKRFWKPWAAVCTECGRTSRPVCSRRLTGRRGRESHRRDRRSARRPAAPRAQGAARRARRRLRGRVDGYVIDLVRADGELVEIQTGGFLPAASKARRAARPPPRPHRPPDPGRAADRPRSTRTARCSRTKRSPKKPSAATIFEGLVSFPTLLSHPNLTIEVLLCREDHVRKPAPVRGRRYLRDPGERRLIEVLQRIELSSARRRGRADPVVRRALHHPGAGEGDARPAPARPEDRRTACARSRCSSRPACAAARRCTRADLNWARPNASTSCQKAPTLADARASRSASTSTSAAGHARSIAHQHVLRHLRRPPARRRADAAPRRRAADADRPRDRRDARDAAAPARAAAPRCSTATCRTSLASRLADVIEMRALVPVARVRTRELTLAVLNARPEDRRPAQRRDHTRACAGASRPPPCAATTGSSSASTRCCADTLSLPEATVPLVDEAVAAAGGAARGHERQARPRRSSPTRPRTAPPRSSSPACSR